MTTWAKITKGYKPLVQKPVGGNALGSVKIILDYALDDTNRDRYAALLEVKDYSEGSTDTITINPSDAGSTTWTENSDFNASTDNDTTASAIATAINGTTNFYASAVTGHTGNPYVYVIYEGGGYISSTSSGDANAWEFYTINATNGTIAEIASDTSGTNKDQPFFTDSDGYANCYIKSPAKLDVEYVRSGQTFDNSRRENIDVGLVTDGSGTIDVNNFTLDNAIIDGGDSTN